MKLNIGVVVEVNDDKLGLLLDALQEVFIKHNVKALNRIYNGDHTESNPSICMEDGVFSKCAICDESLVISIDEEVLCSNTDCICSISGNYQPYTEPECNNSDEDSVIACEFAYNGQSYRCAVHG